VAIIPARPQKPRDKPKVEKAVQEVERQILAPIRDVRFNRFSELNEAIRARLEQMNGRRMKSYGMSRRERFEAVDQPALKPLPQYPFVFARWQQAKVSPDYHIQVEHHYYSVPYQFVRRQVSIKITESLVEVFYEHQRIAAHPRSRAPYRHTTLAEHMPPEHWAYKSQSKAKFLAWAEQIGPQTRTQAEAIFESKAHEEQAFRTLKGVQRLASRYGAERLEAACARANTFDMVGLQRLKAILETHLDESSAQPETIAMPIDHDNVRGQTYYA
jgi:transposase